MDPLGAAKATQIAADAVKEVATGAEATVHQLADQAQVSLADLASVFGGEIDRATTVLREQSDAWRSEVVSELGRLNDLLERLLTKGLVLRGGE